MHDIESQRLCGRGQGGAMPGAVGVSGLLSQSLAACLPPGPALRRRHIAIYLSHVGLGLSQRRVGELFGRDRTTVRWVCARIENRRDEKAFDHMLEASEIALRSFVTAFLPQVLGGRA